MSVKLWCQRYKCGGELYQVASGSEMLHCKKCGCAYEVRMFK